MFINSTQAQLVTPSKLQEFMKNYVQLRILG
jgi:hypothetical protein